MLPAYNKKLTLTYKNALTGDIIETLNGSFEQAVDSVKSIAGQFKGNNIFDSAQNVWNFVRHKINYVKDPEGLQIIQLPQATIRRGLKVNGNKKGSDCKSMSLLCSSILYNLGAENVRLRYVSFGNNPTPTHVYCVFSLNGVDVPVDPVIDKFNYEKPHKHKIDYKMKVYTLSGIGATKIEKLEKLQKLVKPGSLHYNLINKAITKENGGRLAPLSLNPIQYDAYKNRLLNMIKVHEKAGKTGLLYQLTVNEYNDLLNGNLSGSIAGIGKLSIKKIVKGAKKISLAPTRNAFLGLIEINMFGLASKIAASKNQDKFKKLWESFGGDPGKLFKLVDKAKNKRPILGKRQISGYDDTSIGAAPAAAAVIAAAAPIVAAVLKLLSQEKGQPLFNEDGSPVIDPATGKQAIGKDDTLLSKITNILPDLGEAAGKLGKIVDFDEKGNPSTAADVEITDKQPTGFAINKNLLIFGGAAVLGAVLLFKRK